MSITQNKNCIFIIIRTSRLIKIDCIWTYAFTSGRLKMMSVSVEVNFLSYSFRSRNNFPNFELSITGCASFPPPKAQKDLKTVWSSASDMAIVDSRAREITRSERLSLFTRWQLPSKSTILLYKLVIIKYSSVTARL